MVQFDTEGFYEVSLTTSNGFGNSTKTKSYYLYIFDNTCTYCSSSVTNANYMQISNIKLNTLNNTTAHEVGYNDFTSLSTELVRGDSYDLFMSCYDWGSNSNYYAVFIDWNQDCDFYDAGESYYLGNTIGSGTLSTNISVPSDAVLGLTRMRASIKYGSNPSSCGTISYGEVEDYSLKIVAAPTLENVDNVTLGSGETDCFDATGILTVSENGPVVLGNGSNSEFIAGNKIIFKPGFKALSNSYVHASISSGTYCGGATPSIGAPTPFFEVKTTDVDMISSNGKIRVYPNPSSGLFNIDLSRNNHNQLTRLEVYNPMGEKLVMKDITGRVSCLVDLTKYNRGVYFIAVLGKDYHEVIKVIKN